MGSAHLIAATMALISVACKDPPADLREWTVADHQGETNNPERARQTPAATSAAPAGLDEVTLATWSNNCTICHGKLGRGDGPQAPLVKPRDLTDPTWQAQVSDEQIASVIQTGRGLMPAFTLPPSTVQSLVQLVRRLAALRPSPSASASGAANAVPAPKAAPSAARALPGAPAHATSATPRPAAGP